jgi:hypothetical protein
VRTNGEIRNWREKAGVICSVRRRLEPRKFEFVGQPITGSIRGTVLEPSGAVGQAATVTAKHIETGLTRAAVTDRQGAYVLAERPIGHYQVEVHLRGFQKYLQQGISLDVNETATVSIHLKVGAETQQFEVRADAALVQSTASSLGETVMEREILDLPLDGRNFSQLGAASTGRCAFDSRPSRSRRPGTTGPGLCRQWAAAGVEQFSDRRC